MSLAPWLLGAIGIPAAAYGALAGYAWWHYGSPAKLSPDQDDPLLGELMPVYDIVERHSIQVHAPASVTLKAAAEVNLFASPLVRIVFRTRELVLNADGDTAKAPTGLIELAQSLGWAALADSPSREIVMGAVTQPWKANVVFLSVPPERFRGFSRPDSVKIAWTLRADPIGSCRSLFRTETRAVATDEAARAKFRRYWSLVSPGVWLIRRLMLRPIKRGAERQFRIAAA